MIEQAALNQDGERPLFVDKPLVKLKGRQLTRVLVVDDNFYHIFAIKEMIKQQSKIEVD